MSCLLINPHRAFPDTINKGQQAGHKSDRGETNKSMRKYYNNNNNNTFDHYRNPLAFHLTLYSPYVCTVGSRLCNDTVCLYGWV